MTVEQDYYENEDFWLEEVFLDQKERFLGISRSIPDDVHSLLDVGCGNGAFVHLLLEGERKFDEIHATDRSQTALKHVRAAKTPASIDALPFDDRSYDLVSCLEVIEHLPVPVFDKALSELTRVADKYVLIGVPNEQDLDKSLITCPHCRSQFNPDYHMHSFTKDDMASLLAPHGFRARDTIFLGPKKNYFLVTALLEQRQKSSSQGNPFWTDIPCPMCAYSLPPEGSLPATDVNKPDANMRSVLSTGFKSFIKALVPSRTSFGWVVALYEREDSI